MIGFLRRIFNRRSYPLNRIYISREALLNNYRFLSRFQPHLKVAPVLKSNAYGHGISLVAQALDDLGCPFFCLDSLFEAYELFKIDIKTPILIMGYIDPKSLMIKRLPFMYAVWDLELAKVINKYQKGAKVHVFVDTGMHREGVLVDELPEFLDELKRLEDLEIVGLMSHLAEGDKGTSTLTKKQVRNFKKAQEIFKSKKLKIKWSHLLNSPGFFGVGEKVGNIARIGRDLYGIEASHKKDILRSVLRLETKIVQIKKISKKERVGYDGTYLASRKTLIGILPIGYNDGVDRRLSNKGVVLVEGIECPIIGLISMNLTTIDISEVKGPYVGQNVTVFSDNPNDKNSIESSSIVCRTIPYDLLIHLDRSTKREII